MRNMTMTQDDFIRHEMRVWDEEYVESLLNAGYVAVLTTAGWKWILPVDTSPEKVSDNANIESVPN